MQIFDTYSVNTSTVIFCVWCTLSHTLCTLVGHCLHTFCTLLTYLFHNCCTLLTYFFTLWEIEKTTQMTKTYFGRLQAPVPISPVTRSSLALLGMSLSAFPFFSGRICPSPKMGSIFVSQFFVKTTFLVGLIS